MRLPARRRRADKIPQGKGYCEIPTFKKWGEGKNSEKRVRRKSRRSREVMSRKAKGGILGSLKTWSEASSVTV